MNGQTKTAFAPVLTIPNGTFNVDFYKDAFGAIEQMKLLNDDGSIHVAELVIDGAMFHVHEVTEWSGTLSPLETKTLSVVLGLMVADVHGVMDRAVAAGATLRTPTTDYDYGYRQGDIVDPFGYRWTIQCEI